VLPFFDHLFLAQVLPFWIMIYNGSAQTSVDVLSLLRIIQVPVEI
jgi:hypothetical protein